MSQAPVHTQRDDDRATDLQLGLQILQRPAVKCVRALETERLGGVGQLLNARTKVVEHPLLLEKTQQRSW